MKIGALIKKKKTFFNVFLFKAIFNKRSPVNYYFIFYNFYKKSLSEWSECFSNGVLTTSSGCIEF